MAVGCLIVTALNDRGVLYGTFTLLRKMALTNPLPDWMTKRILTRRSGSSTSGTISTARIERGYAGGSIFWANGHIVPDLTRVGDYARLLASLGIDGCSINNVNADPHAIDSEHIPELARVAAAFRPWGVKLFVCINFGSPKSIGGLDTFDPLDPRVIDFWNKKVEEIYAAIPDFGGFIMKADSEGELGPSAYGRTHADAANVVARPLKAHGGIVFYRGFVYNHHADWRNLKLDRAKAAYDNFHHLDGQFDDNVIVQIKNGPIDFQVREPASPLFGGLEKTAMALEVQITQEYLGQQRHLCFEVPMWKETLDFDLHAKGPNTPVKALVAGKVFGQPTGGFAGVANVGLDTNWLAHPLAMANLYGFGRLAWNPDLSSTTNRRGMDEADLRSRPAGRQNDLRYAVEIVAHLRRLHRAAGRGRIDGHHRSPLRPRHRIRRTQRLGPVDSRGQQRHWHGPHRGDRHRLHRAISSRPSRTCIESLTTCPDELLLFFHHVPYNYVLHSGKTVIQHVYDTHYTGVEQVQEIRRTMAVAQGQD